MYIPPSLLVLNVLESNSLGCSGGGSGCGVATAGLVLAGSGGDWGEGLTWTLMSSLGSAFGCGIRSITAKKIPKQNKIVIHAAELFFPFEFFPDDVSDAFIIYLVWPWARLCEKPIECFCNRLPLGLMLVQ